ncbi:hypothetical protein BDK51DRAFT_36640 [Blyttiomyces helicus]|uniref:Uncharacterized protein n=1 Tax=Blyttiomyces helicus TaxID=388810 RepID=A0A4P9W1J7_9FUNG|nr:hypothetical protein BDK51DRAFT_36640 [Blyttiomyces helicus]|eukprot:RKO86061.1 hypothetical protein BDK51DRAFT_36640 [Blyttiomyces helicus]
MLRLANGLVQLVSQPEAVYVFYRVEDLDLSRGGRLPNLEIVKMVCQAGQRFKTIHLRKELARVWHVNELAVEIYPPTPKPTAAGTSGEETGSTIAKHSPRAVPLLQDVPTTSEDCPLTVRIVGRAEATSGSPLSLFPRSETTSGSRVRACSPSESVAGEPASSRPRGEGILDYATWYLAQVRLPGSGDDAWQNAAVFGSFEIVSSEYCGRKAWEKGQEVEFQLLPTAPGAIRLKGVGKVAAAIKKLSLIVISTQVELQPPAGSRRLSSLWASRWWMALPRSMLPGASSRRIPTQMGFFHPWVPGEPERWPGFSGPLPHRRHLGWHRVGDQGYYATLGMRINQIEDYRHYGRAATAISGIRLSVRPPQLASTTLGRDSRDELGGETPAVLNRATAVILSHKSSAKAKAFPA